MTRRYSLAQLLANQTPGGRGLLADEILRKTGRRHGPKDDRCEVCGGEAESFLLADWEHWHCQPCAMAAAS